MTLRNIGWIKKTTDEIGEKLFMNSVAVALVRSFRIEKLRSVEYYELFTRDIPVGMTDDANPAYAYVGRKRATQRAAAALVAGARTASRVGQASRPRSIGRWDLTQLCSPMAPRAMAQMQLVERASQDVGHAYGRART